jgi:uncharacterized RDD family membrane protein YckC
MTYPTDPPAGSSPPASPPAPPAVSWEAPAEEAGPAPGVKFASHGTRLVAYIIDSLIVFLLYIVIFVVAVIFAAAADRTTAVSGPSAAAAALFGLLVLITIVLALAYFPFFWARSGQTPGMRPFGLYVVRDSDGGKISAGQAILRLIGLVIGGIPLYLGYIWIFIDSRRRGWHDLIAGTVMIERKR